MKTNESYGKDVLMKHTNQPLFAEERQAQIIELLEKNDKMTVPELANLYHVSTVTIRTDLRTLDAAGKLKRTHGGAISIEKSGFEPTSTMKEIEHPGEKRAIAQRALELIENGDTIILDTGTTTYELSSLLHQRNGLTVITNDLKIALNVETTTDASLIFVGGIVRRGFHCTTGPIAVSALTDLNADKAFLATNSFTPEKGFMTPTLQQAEIKRAFMTASVEKIMLADSSKFGQISFVRFAALSEFNQLITDQNLPEEQLLNMNKQASHTTIIRA